MNDAINVQTPQSFIQHNNYVEQKKEKIELLNDVEKNTNMTKDKKKHVANNFKKINFYYDFNTKTHFLLTEDAKGNVIATIPFIELLKLKNI